MTQHVEQDATDLAGEATEQRIVVGIDGSDTSRRALRWALDEARLRGASLEVVHAWRPPYAAAYPYAAGAFDPSVFEKAAIDTLNTAIDAECTTDLVRPVERTLVAGGAASAVLDASKGADLVVVGARGLGGFSGLLLG